MQFNDVLAVTVYNIVFIVISVKGFFFFFFLGANIFFGIRANGGGGVMNLRKYLGNILVILYCHWTIK